MHDISIGESVFIYSLTLNEVIQGRVEGFSEVDRMKIKVLQRLPDGYIRHIVSYAYVFKDKESACRAKEEHYVPKSSRDISTGMTVHLKVNNSLLKDDEGHTLLYQVISDHGDEVSLVTSYGEMIGKFSKSDIVLNNVQPLFSSSMYEIGQKVSWLSNDSIYEGTVTRLREKTAEVMDIKLLYPLDTKMNIPYYKLSSDLQDASQILTTVIGDNLED